MVMAFVCALALYLMIEAPFRKIFKELLMPKREPINIHQKRVQEDCQPNGSAFTITTIDGSDVVRNQHNNISTNSVEDSKL